MQGRRVPGRRWELTPATPGFVEPWPLALSLWVLWWVQLPHGLTLLSLP